MVCSDNMLVAGEPAAVRARVAEIDARVRALGALYSQVFAPPSTRVRYLGAVWDLASRTRQLPVGAARRMAAALRSFAYSRGPLRLACWRRVSGYAGWVGAVCSVDPALRQPLVVGMRVVQRRGRLVPSAAVRRAALLHARAALLSVPLSAPAVRPHMPLRASSVPAGLPVFACDAARPGAVAVVQLAPCRRLLFWRRSRVDEHIVHAEAAALEAAACAIRRMRLPAAVLVNDASAPHYAALKGTSRSVRLARCAAAVRAAAPELYLVRVPSSDNAVADAASRAGTRDDAARAVERASARGLGADDAQHHAGLIRRRSFSHSFPSSF
jgi:hypothetical protein